MSHKAPSEWLNLTDCSALLDVSLRITRVVLDEGKVRRRILPGMKRPMYYHPDVDALLAASVTSPAPLSKAS